MLMPSLFRENMFDDFFEDFMQPARSVMRYNAPSSGIMRTDIRETDTGYELDIDLPGFQKEDVSAELKDGYLTVCAATDSSKEDKDEKGRYLRRERSYGSCSRSFYVGDGIRQEDIKAKFENGILKISVPKPETAPAVEENRYIAIEG